MCGVAGIVGSIDPPLFAALRKIIGSRSSSQLLHEADRIADELRDALDEDSKFFGCSVRARPRHLATCLR